MITFNDVWDTNYDLRKMRKDAKTALELAEANLERFYYLETNCDMRTWLNCNEKIQETRHSMQRKVRMAQEYFDYLDAIQEHITPLLDIMLDYEDFLYLTRQEEN